MRTYGWDYKNHRSTSIIHNSMETNTFKDLLPEDLRNCEASPAVWAYIADLLEKVSELQKEIERLKAENKGLKQLVNSLSSPD